MQHRANRGMGGDPRGFRDRPSNLILLCWETNARLESDAYLAQVARERGWKVSMHADPASVPVWHHGLQAWFLLSDDWTRIVVTD